MLTTASSSNLYTQLLTQLQRFIQQQQFTEAERTWQILLRSFQSFTVNELERFFNHTYRLHQYFLTYQLDNAKLMCSKFEEIWCNNALLTKELQADFHLRIGQAYFIEGHYDQAPIHYTQALRTAEQVSDNPTLIENITAHLDQLETIYHFQLILPKLLESHLPKESAESLAEETILTLWRALMPLFSTLVNEQAWHKLDIFYKKLAPFHQRLLKIFHNTLHKKKQSSLAAFTRKTEIMLSMASLWYQHQQYHLASQVYDCIAKHAEKEAAHFDTNQVLALLAEADQLESQKQTNPVFKLISNSHWRSNRLKLHEMRQQLQAGLKTNQSVAILQKNFTQQLKNLLEQILQNCEQWLGTPPCPFLIMGIGSIARNCPGPYSDLDCAILIADKKLKHHSYFQTFIQLFKYQLDLLGENNPPGLRIDSGDLGHFTSNEKDLINTPKGLAKHFNPAKVDPGQPEPYSLHRPTFLYASKNGEILLDDYLKLLAEKFEFAKTISAEPFIEKNTHWPVYQRLGLQYLLEHQRQFEIEVEKSDNNQIELKKRYLSPLLLWLSDIALYFGIHQFDTENLLKALRENNYLHPHFIQQLDFALNDLQRLRMHAQLKARYQNDIVCKSSPNVNFSEQFLLSENDYQRLLQIDALVLQVAYRSISALKQLKEPCFDPITTDFQMTIAIHQDAKQSPLAIRARTQKALTCLAQTLVDRSTSILEHRAYYQQLPTALRESYLQTYLLSALQQALQQQKINAPDMQTLIDILQYYPNPNGTRPITVAKVTHWDEKFLQLFTEPYHESQTKAYHGTDRVLIEYVSSKGIVKRLLKKTFQQQLFKHKGELNNIFHQQLDGQRLVIPLKDSQDKLIAYAKVFPELPGVQVAVDSLTHHLSGYGLLTHMAKLEHCYDGNIFPVLFSQPVKGKNLQEAIREGTLAVIDKALDSQAFTWKVLENLLVYPEDEKADNLIAVPFRNAQGQSSFRLISVDSDHAFIEPLLQTGTPLNRKEKVQVKSIVWCMDAMRQPLNLQAIEEFLSLDPLTLMNDWLYGLQIINQRLMGDTETKIPGIFTREQIKQWVDNKTNFCFVPVAFEPGRIALIYQQIRRLQALLSQEDLPKNHLELLVRIEPRLAKYYEEAFEGQHTPEKRFAALPTDYAVIEEKQTQTVIYQSTFKARERTQRSITITDAKYLKDLKTLIEKGEIFGPEKAQRFELQQIDYQYRNIKQLRDELQQGEITKFSKLENANYIKEQVINSIDFSSIKATNSKSAKEIQQAILQTLTTISFRKLNLSYCLIDDKTLEEIVKKNPEIVHLDLRSCSRISDRIVRAIAKYCPNLEVLYLGQNEQLQQITDQNAINWVPLYFPKLKKVQVAACRNVARLNFKAPQLKELNASHCSSLIAISTGSQALTTLNLTGCKQLTETQLVTIAEETQQLVRLNLTGCLLINHITFREKYPFGLMIEWSSYSEVWIQRFDRAIQKALTDFHLEDHNSLVRISLYRSLTCLDTVRNKKIIQALLPALKDVNREVRAATAKALGQLGQASDLVIQALFLALKDLVSKVRAVAANALGQSGHVSDAVIQGLLSALKSSKWRVRAAAAKALGQLGQASDLVIQALLSALKDLDWNVRAAAAKALGQLGQASDLVIQALLSALKDLNWNVKAAAVKALGQLGHVSEEIIQDLLSALQDSNEEVRAATAKGLSQLGHASDLVIQALLLNTKDLVPKVRATTAKALGQLGFASYMVIPALQSTLKDLVPKVRAAAAKALGQLGFVSYMAIPDLLSTALRDSDWNVRAAAANALGQLGFVSDMVIQALLLALKDSDWIVRAAATNALGQLGQVSDTVIQALLSALKDANENRVLSKLPIICQNFPLLVRKENLLDEMGNHQGAGYRVI